MGTGNPLKTKPSVHPALRDGSPPKKINNTKVPPSLPPPWTQGREGPASAGGWGPAPSDDISGTVVRALRAGYLSAARERGADPRITVRAETGGALSGVIVGRLRADFAGFAHRKQAESLRSKLTPPR